MSGEVSDFRLLIAWHGPEDKPFYKALLVSPSRIASIARRPFWNHAVIGAAEFARIAEVLRTAEAHPLTAGPYRPEGTGYYVEMEADRRTYHCSLGLDESTGSMLRQMAAALEPDHRQPIQAILTRIGQA
jgi:hypothetical protein